MHEMSIAVELLAQLQAVAAEHGVDRVDELTVRAGALRGVVPEALDIAFECVAEGTLAEGATVNLEIVPAEVRCRACGDTYQPEPDSYLCGKCGQADVDVLSGNEILLTSVSARQESAG